MSERETAEESSGELGGADCVETIHTLYHYLDGELTDDRRAAIAVHLDECAPCLKAIEFEAELRRVIADRCKDHVPDSLRERISAAIDHEALKSERGES